MAAQNKKERIDQSIKQAEVLMDKMVITKTKKGLEGYFSGPFYIEKFSRLSNLL
jgi:hypothetical protein